MKQTDKIDCFSNHPDALHRYLSRLKELISREGWLNHIYLESGLEEVAEESNLLPVGRCKIRDGKSFELNNSNPLLEEKETRSSPEAGSGPYLIHVDLDESASISAHDLLDKLTDLLEKQVLEKTGPDFRPPLIFILFDNPDGDLSKSEPDREWMQDNNAYHTTLHSTGISMLRELNKNACSKLESIGLSQ